MDKLAVDIVLIPPGEIIKLAVDISRACSESVDDDYALNTKNCFPHLTLLLGKVSRDSLPDVEKILEDITKEFPPLDLELSSINDLTKNNPAIDRKKERREFLVTKTDELIKLHKAVLVGMEPFLITEPATHEMFIDPMGVSNKALGWVDTFAKKTVLENFRPHISLGPARPEGLTFPIKFTASRLALCHLGPHCTCRKVLWETKLSKL